MDYRHRKSCGDLWALPYLRRERTRSFVGCRPVGRRTRHNWRTVLDRTYYGCFIHTVEVGDGGELLLAAHSVDQALLPARKHGVRKNWKVAEHPEQIYALQERRHNASRSNRRLHLYHAGREFLDQHIGPTRNLKTMNAILGPPLLHPQRCHGKLFFTDSALRRAGVRTGRISGVKFLGQPARKDS